MSNLNQSSTSFFSLILAGLANFGLLDMFLPYLPSTFSPGTMVLYGARQVREWPRLDLNRRSTYLSLPTNNTYGTYQFSVLILRVDVQVML